MVGQKIRLGPGERAELPEHCVRAPEVRALCAEGVLAAFDAEPADAPGSSTEAEPRAPQETSETPGSRLQGYLCTDE